MNSIDQLDNMRSLWQQMSRSENAEDKRIDVSQVLDYMRVSERSSLVSRLVRRHVILGLLGVIILPADMIFCYLEMGLPGYLAILLSIFGLFAGGSAFWVAWQAKNIDYGSMTMREAWHKTNTFYRRRNILRTISMCIGIPLVIMMIISFNEVIGRPAMVGGIVGAVIGGAVGLYTNWRTRQQMRALRDTFSDE